MSNAWQREHGGTGSSSGSARNCRCASKAEFSPSTTTSLRRGEDSGALRDAWPPVGVMDAFLSATAEVHRLTLVTRNVSDFPTLKTVVNPRAQLGGSEPSGGSRERPANSNPVK